MERLNHSRIGANSPKLEMLTSPTHKRESASSNLARRPQPHSYPHLFTREGKRVYHICSTAARMWFVFEHPRLGCSHPVLGQRYLVSPPPKAGSAGWGGVNPISPAASRLPEWPPPHLPDPVGCPAAGTRSICC